MRKSSSALPYLLLGALTAAACGDSTGSGTFAPSSSAGSGGTTSGGAAGASPGGSASTSGSASAGSAQTGGTGSGGTSAAGASSLGGSAGAGTSAGSGGASAGAAGSSNTAGINSGGNAGTSSGGSSNGGSSAGGSGGSSGGADQCKPIGWATRSGRSGGAASVTGGGNAAPNVVKTYADLAKFASDGQARVIHIDGNLGGGWSGTDGDRLEIKSNKTIVGLRPGTQIKAAIHISGASNVILRNIVIQGPGSNDDQAWDNINIEGSSKNVWVDHCEFWDGQDGNADVVKGADNVTFSWSIFGYTKKGDHNLSNLIASSDDEPASVGKLNVTFMFNWWKAVAQRQPRCRYGQIHVVNNLYTSDSSVGASQLGVSNGFDCNVLTENNHFIGQGQPIDLGKEDGDDSVQEAVGNIFESCTGNQKGSGTAFKPPYDYKSFMVPANQVKALVQQNAGAKLASPTACASF